MSIEYKRKGFQSADINTDYMSATAEIALTDTGSSSVHVKIDPTTFWGSSDLRELAEYLNDIANELDGN